MAVLVNMYVTRMCLFVCLGPHLSVSERDPPSMCPRWATEQGGWWGILCQFTLCHCLIAGDLENHFASPSIISSTSVTIGFICILPFWLSVRWLKFFPYTYPTGAWCHFFAGKGVVWDVGELWRSGELESGCFRGCTIRSSCNFPSISSRSRLVARALLYPPPYVCFFFPRARTPLSCPKLLKCGKWIRRK